MHIVLGATGHIGSHLVAALSGAGESVIAVVRDGAKAAALAGPSIEVAVADIRATETLRSLFQRGQRAFLLNPPGDPTGDSNADELATGQSIAAALERSGLEKVVLASTYGAQPGDAIGDLSTLYQLERAVETSGIPAAINRAAYYFTNLDMLLEPAGQGILPTAFPAEFVLPMVAPADIAAFAAERLLSSVDDSGVRYIEGPARYSFADVAKAFAAKLGHPVEVQTTPREQWAESFRAIGFSDVASRSFAAMTGATLDAPDLPDDPARGGVTLTEYINAI